MTAESNGSTEYVMGLQSTAAALLLIAMHVPEMLKAASEFDFPGGLR